MLNENSFYTDQASKDILLKDLTLLADLFWINFLGTIILYNVDSKNAKLVTYLKKDRVQLATMTDSNSDFTIIVKLLDEAGLITTTVSTEITKFMAILKKGTITSVDENLIRAMLGRIKVTKVKPSPLIRGWVMNFENGKINLATNNLIKFLYSYSKKNKIAAEFIDLAKHMISKIDDDDIKPTAANGGSTPTTIPASGVALDPVTNNLIAKFKSKNSINTIISTPIIQPKLTTWQDFADNMGATIDNIEEAVLLLYKVWSMSKTEIKKTLKLYGMQTINATDFNSLISYIKHELNFNIILSPYAATSTINLNQNNFPNVYNLLPSMNSDVFVNQFTWDNSISMIGKDNEFIKTLFRDLYLLSNVKNDAKYFQALLDNSSSKITKNKNSYGRGYTQTKQYDIMWEKAGIKGSLSAFLAEEPLITINNWLSTSPSSVVSNLIISKYNRSDISNPVLQIIAQQIYTDLSKEELIKILPTILLFKDKPDFINILSIMYNYRKLGEDLSTRNLFSKAKLLNTLGFTQWVTNSEFKSGITLNDKQVLKMLNDARYGYTQTIFKDFIKEQGLYNFCIKNGVTNFVKLVFDSYGNTLENEHNTISLSRFFIFLDSIVLTLDNKEIISEILNNINAKISDISDVNLIKIFTDYPYVKEIIYEKVKNKFNIYFEKDYSYDLEQFFKNFSQFFSNEELWVKIMESVRILNKLDLYDLVDYNYTVIKTQFGIPFLKEKTADILDILFAGPAGAINININKKITRLKSFIIHALEDNDVIFTDKSLEPFVDMFSNSISYSLNMDNVIKLSICLANVPETMKTYELILSMVTPSQKIEIESASIYIMINNKKCYIPGFKEYIKSYATSAAAYISKPVISDDEIKYIRNFKSMCFSPENKLLDDPSIVEIVGIDPVLLNKFKNDYIRLESKDSRFNDFGVSSKTTFDIFTDPENFDIDVKVIVMYNEANAMAKKNLSKKTMEEVEKKFGTILFDIYNDTKYKSDFEQILTIFKDNGHYVHRQLRDIVLIKPLLDQITHSSTPIKPEIDLTDKDILNVLRMNNFDFSNTTTIKKSNKMTYYDYFQKIENTIATFDSSQIELKTTPFENDTPELLEKRTAELYKYYTKNSAHGDVGLKILASHNCSITFPEFDEFIKNNPTPNVIPAFHGTGTVAASMILRFGFKVVSRNQAAAAGIGFAGRMLGDGVYVGGFVDKACGYVRDCKDFSRKWGQIGYLLECEAYLGKKRLNYNEAGNGGDAIRSVEYCLFDARAQIKIVRAHRVQITSRRAIAELYTKYFKNEPVTEETTQFPLMFKSFKSMLKENESMKEYITEEGTEKPLFHNNVISYEFMEDKIPVDNNKFVDAETFITKYCNKKVTLSVGQVGYVIEINIDQDLYQNTVIPYTNEFMITNPNGLFTQYLFFLKKAL